MVSYPTTPSTPTDCGQVTDEEDYTDSGVEGEYTFVFGLSPKDVLAGDKDPDVFKSTFDKMTSVGAARAHVKKKKGHILAGRDFSLAVGGARPRFLQNLYERLRDVFDGVDNPDHRILTVMVAQCPLVLVAA